MLIHSFTCIWSYKHNIASGYSSEAWAANTLGVGIFVLTGGLKQGAQATQVFNGDATDKIWLVSHPVTDGAGHVAPHFSLVSKEPELKMFKMFKMLKLCDMKLKRTH